MLKGFLWEDNTGRIETGRAGRSMGNLIREAKERFTVFRKKQKALWYYHSLIWRNPSENT